jgi:type VII secretion protein EccB
MPSRRDQIQSYQFFVQRVISAFVAREPDPAQSPFRRLGGAGVGSIMIAVTMLAAVGIYGFLFPGGAKKWQDGKSVIQEKETGALYVYRDGALNPVANQASALLALGSFAPTTKVSSSSLVGTRRGVPIGIPDAPSALPAAKRLLTGAWSLCSQPARDQAGQSVATTVLTVGREPGGGQRPGDVALLARDTRANQLYLVWHDHRYRITDEKVVLEGLAMGSEPQLPVGGAWLNSLPAGVTIGTRAVDGRGTPSTAVGGALVGQVFVVQAQDGSRQYYLAERDRLAPVTEVQADILLADPATAAAYPNGRKLGATDLGAAAAAQAPKATAPASGPEQAPTSRPQIVHLPDDRPTVCATYPNGATDPKVLFGAALPQGAGQVRTAEQTSGGTPLADRVLIEPGYGALVLAVPSPGATTGTLSLVTDLGIRYALPDSTVASMLGYGKAKPVRLPASLVIRLPAGPALDPVAAKQPTATN